MTADSDITNDTLTILYQDEQLIAVHKPAGLLVHRSPIDRHETRFALQMLRQQIGRPVFPLHRLDKPTSGLLLFAFNSEIASVMGKAFINQQVDKRYLAVVRGYTAASGKIDHPIKPKFDKYEQRTQKDAKPALTEFNQLATIELPICVDKYPSTRYSLLDLRPRSGRKHQLRHHLKHISHPIIGDPKYGKSRHNRFFQQHFNSSRLLLACYEMEFKHPSRNEAVRINCPLQDNFYRLIEHFEWQKQLPINLQKATI